MLPGYERPTRDDCAAIGEDSVVMDQDNQIPFHRSYIERAHQFHLTVRFALSFTVFPANDSIHTYGLVIILNLILKFHFTCKVAMTRSMCWPV
jgi:hypothetical protein